MYVKLDRTIIGRLTRIGDTLFELRVPVAPGIPSVQFPTPTLSTLILMTAHLKGYWKSYQGQEAPGGVGLGRLLTGAVQTLSASTAIADFLLRRDERHAVIPFSCWLKREKEPVQGDKPLSRDEREFVKGIRYLLNVMKDLASLAMAQALDLTEHPDGNELKLRRELCQVAERIGEKAIELLENMGLRDNPLLDEWRERLVRAHQVQAVLLLVDARLHDDIRGHISALLKKVA